MRLENILLCLLVMVLQKAKTTIVSDDSENQIEESAKLCSLQDIDPVRDGIADQKTAIPPFLDKYSCFRKPFVFFKFLLPKTSNALNGPSIAKDNLLLPSESPKFSEKSSEFTTASFSTNTASETYDVSDSSKENLDFANTTTRSISISSKCHNIEPAEGPCPKGFSKSIYPDGCYLITKKQSFPPTCPYPHFLPHHEKENITREYLGNTTIWVNAFRNVTSGFPDFEWTENGAQYGIVTENITNSQGRSKNCLVAKEGKFFQVSCSEKHVALCAYSSSRLVNAFGRSLCIKENSQCILAHYNLTQPTCFCLIYGEGQPKTDFCNKLAEPIYEFQTQLIARAFFNSICWIGMRKNKSIKTKYIWSSTNTDVDYTYWAQSDSCRYSEGAFQFRPGAIGWKLVKDGTLNCALCEVTPILNTPALKLHYAYPSHDVIKLSISNFHSLTKLYHTPDVYCFSDFSRNNLKERVDYRTEGEIKLSIKQDVPSYYWCEAFHYTSSAIIKSNTIIAFKIGKGYGNEFSVFVIAKMQPNTTLTPKIYDRTCSVIEKHISLKHNMILSLRPMRAYFNESHQALHLLIHITTKPTLESTLKEFTKLITSFEDFKDPTIRIIGVSSSEVCLSTKSLTIDGESLDWPTIRIGATAIPSNKLCLDASRQMQPVTRKCKGNFLYGAKWAQPVGTCYKNTTYAERTQKLFDLNSLNASAEGVAQELLQLIKETTDKEPIDIHLIATILEKLLLMPGEKVECQSFVAIISEIMKGNAGILREAQVLLNSTDKILASLDEFLKDEKSIRITSANLMVYIEDIQKTNTIGVAFYSKRGAHSFEQYTIQPIPRNISVNALAKEVNLETAVLLNQDVPIEISKPIRLVTTVFYNDFLFNQRLNSTLKLRTKITSVSIPGFDAPLVVLFRMTREYNSTKSCSHWNYGLNSVLLSIHGKWTIDSPSRKTGGFLELCEFQHMTHFGVLLDGAPKQEVNEHALEIITVVGSALSLIGIIPIFVTGIFIKPWRERPRNIILINFCIAITAQIVFTFLMQSVVENGWLCKIVGIGLHYTVLSEFCWMFVTALLQYRRVVVVLNPKEGDVLRRGYLIGWCVPLVPVFVTIAISPDNYSVNEHNVCYLTGRYLTYAMKLPLIIILSLNAAIFVKILYTVSRLKVGSEVGRHQKHKLEILLGVLLFFVLGASWLFGFTGALGGGVVFMYMFCITATLRGIVLFLFFIAGNRETRLMWSKYTAWHLRKKVQKLKNKHHQVE